MAASATTTTTTPTMSMSAGPTQGVAPTPQQGQWAAPSVYYTPNQLFSYHLQGVNPPGVPTQDLNPDGSMKPNPNPTNNGTGTPVPGTPYAYPNFNNPYNPTTMSDINNLKNIGPQYSEGFNALRSQALNQGPSQWLNMSQLKNQMSMEDALNNAQNTAAGKTAAGADALAAGGGLSAGARERLQEGGAANLMAMDQGVQRTGMEQNLGLEATDQSNRIGQLNSLVSDENTKQNQWNQAYMTDVQSEENNVNQQNQWNKDIYNTQMQAWAANQQAAATANSGKK